MPRVERVLIVGAGIAGLALARKLNSIGIDVDLLERRSHAAAHGAGIFLTGNAVRVLHSLGLDRILFEHSRPVDMIRFTDQRERELFHVDLSTKPNWPRFVSIKRDALQRILLDAALPLVPRWGTTIVSLHARLDLVEVALSDGTRSHYDLIVGADGVHSQVRNMLFGDRVIKPIAHFCGWRFLAPCPARLVAPQYMLGNARTLLLHPLPGGEVYCGAGPVVDAGLDGGNELERMRGAFAAFGGFAADVLAKTNSATALIPTRYWHFEKRPWHADGCVLIGDAAHACTPTLAQGGAMALEDALVLGNLLGQQLERDEILADFEARRAARVAHAMDMSLQRMEANRILAPRELALRDFILPRVGASQLLDAWAPLMESLP